MRAPGVTPDHPDEVLGGHLTQGTRGQLVLLGFVGVKVADAPFSHLSLEFSGLEAQFSKHVSLVGMESNL